MAYSTNLGLALWSCNSVFAKLDEPIHLILTSPPYPLRKPRAYGNPSAKEFVTFLIDALEPLIKCLVPGGSLALNLSNDIFNPGLPSRSTYLERVVIALEDKGLHLMDRIIWSNPSKPPGPIAWASKSRQQLNVGWEPVLWFTNDPKACFSDTPVSPVDYLALRARLIELGYRDEIQWSMNVPVVSDHLEFWAEYAWVVLNSGMKNQIAQKIWGKVRPHVLAGGRAGEVFGHRGKSAGIDHVFSNREALLQQYLSADDKVTSML